MALNARLRVDPVACDAFGYCAELAPELIWLDEWGYPVVDPGTVPPALIEVAQAAVRNCPRKALFLEKVQVEVVRRPVQRRPGVAVAQRGN